MFLNQWVYAVDIEKLKQNFKEFYLLDEVEESEVKLLLNILDQDFSFTDIDYQMHRRSNWQPRTHLKRLITLAKAYHYPKSKYYHSPKMAKVIVGVLNYWTDNNFYSDNWWHQEIGVPQSLGPTLVLCESMIPDTTMIKSLEIMDKSKIYMTGQNKIWLSGNVFMRELLRGNDELIQKSAETIKSVMVLSKPYEEGIQPDFSFHQHGPQPQFGNYGLHFAEDIIKWMFIFNKTDVTFSTEQVDLMRNLMFKGQQKVVYKGKYETLATGRQIFPEEVNGKKYRGPISKADLYKSLEKKFNAFDEHKNPTEAPKEYVHFRNSDYSLYRANTFFTALRMSSQRVIGGEAGNGENLQGYYLGDGTNLIYRRGDEYHEIYPVWNWKKLPGTTTVQDTSKIKVLTWDGYKNGSHFTGGLKSENIGLSAFKYRRDGVEANKSYFFIDNYVYALGSAINSNAEFDLVTTINQCYKKGEVFELKKKGKTTAVWHDSIAYISLDKQELKVTQEKQTGSWKKVLSWHTDELISKDIFDVEINHGKSPNNAAYAYVSVVGIGKNQIKKEIKNTLANVLVLNKKVHALSFNKGEKIAITAFEPCEVTFGKKQKIRIHSPCLLTMEKSNKDWIVKVVDPTQQKKQLSFEISGEFEVETSKDVKIKNKTTLFSIDLPTDIYDKGKSITVVLKKK